MNCRFIQPIVINWCLYITNSISISIYEICKNFILFNIIIFEDLHSNNLKENAEKNNKTEEENHKRYDINKALGNQFNLLTETFENS